MTEIRRIGLLGDIHAEARHLEAALRTFQGEGVDLILSTGDIVDGVGDVERCVELLIHHGVRAVRGNHERWFKDGNNRILPDATFREKVAADAVLWLEALPRLIEVETVAGPLLLGHGVGPDDMSRLHMDTEGYALQCLDALWDLLAEADLRWVVGGHTHRRMLRIFNRPPGAPLGFLNPGTLRFDQGPGFALADFSTGKMSFFDLDRQDQVRPAEVLDLFPHGEAP
jgi:predicted phosphodiesterase